MFILFAFFAKGISYGQKKADTTSLLSYHRQVFQKINNYKGYHLITIDDSEEFLGHATDNGANLTGYFKGNLLDKIVEWTGLSNRVLQNEYYFDNGKLVFVYSTDKRYKFNDSTGQFDYSTIDLTITGRFYFHNDKMIKAISNEKDPEKTKEQLAKDLLSASKQYTKLLKAKYHG